MGFDSIWTFGFCNLYCWCCCWYYSSIICWVFERIYFHVFYSFFSLSFFLSRFLYFLKYDAFAPLLLVFNSHSTHFMWENLSFVFFFIIVWPWVWECIFMLNILFVAQFTNVPSETKTSILYRVTYVNLSTICYVHQMRAKEFSLSWANSFQWKWMLKRKFIFLNSTNQKTMLPMIFAPSIHRKQSISTSTWI